MLQDNENQQQNDDQQYGDNQGGDIDEYIQEN